MRIEIDPLEFFRDYFNDYLTVEKIAEHYGIDTDRAHKLIDEGRDLHNAIAERSKKS